MNGRFTIDKYRRIWNKGDTVMVEMNMSKRIGRIWNKCKTDLIFTIGLPDECTFLLYLIIGNVNQVLTLKDIRIERDL